MSTPKTQKRTAHRSAKGKLVYARRNAKGQFIDIQDPGKSLRADRAKKAKYSPKRKGQGYAGDYTAPKRVKKKSKPKKRGWLARIFG